MPESLACSAVTFSYPGGFISHCVNLLLRSRTETISVKSGVGSFFLGGGVTLFLRSRPGPFPKPPSRSPLSPRRPPPPRRSSNKSLSLLGGLSSSSLLASRLEEPRSLSQSLSPPPRRSPRSPRSLPEYLQHLAVSICSNSGTENGRAC